MARPILFAALSVACCGCARQEPAVPPSQILRISQRNEPADLDPATASLPDEFFIIRALGEGLLNPAPSGGEPQPAAAERYAVSADGLTYTFHLRPDARWSNGDPVTAGDFLASFQRVLTPATAAPKADLFHAVKNARAFASGETRDFSTVGFRATDARTLRVTLEAPAPGFPHYVASGPWIPVHLRTVAQHGRDWTKPEHHVGNGPFTLAEWRSQQRIVVRKNPRYQRARATRLEEIQFLRFDNEDTEERAFRTGQIDVTITVPKTKLASYAQGHPDELHRTLLAETRYLSFNTLRTPLDDVRVRRALSLAIDRARIVDRVLMGGQQPAGRFMPAPLRFASEATSPGPGRSLLAGDSSGTNQSSPASRLLQAEHRFAPDEARRLLGDAGFGQGRNFPKLEVTAWSPSQTPVLEAIQEMWRQELGVVVSIATREGRVHFASLRAGTYDIAFATTLLDVPDRLALFTIFTAGSPDNLPHWRADEYDLLVSRSIAPADRQTGEADLVSAEALLLEQAPVAPVYFNTRNWLMSPRVRGWQDDPLWTRFYHGVYLEER